MRFSLRKLTIGLLVVAGGVAYANSLSGAFVIDDRASIVYNQTIRDLSDLGSILETARDSPVAGRPLPNFTLALNYAMGGLEVEGYHLVNIAIHLLCGLLLVALLGRVLGLDIVSQNLPASPDRIAFATALLWLVHPLNTEVVVYISQRTESLAALLILGTLYSVVRASESVGQNRTSWSVLAVVCCWLGVLTKEVIAVVPILVLAFDAIFLAGSWAESFRKRRALYIGLFGSWVPFALVVAQGTRELSVGFGLGVSAWTYLLNQARFLVRYLRLSIWPDCLVAFYGWPEDLTLAQVWPQAAIVLALLGLTLFSLARRPGGGNLASWGCGSLSS